MDPIHYMAGMARRVCGGSQRKGMMRSGPNSPHLSVRAAGQGGQDVRPRGRQLDNCGRQAASAGGEAVSMVARAAQVAPQWQLLLAQLC
jgi:hypothetical protein